MPANVSLEFIKAKEEYEKARTLKEKLIALKKMYSLAPSHKGAENLRRELTRKIAQIKRELEKEKKSKKAVKDEFSVKKEGMFQIVIIGMPNSGKSTLLKRLTNVDVKIASYPFTTIKPEKGVMLIYNAKFQLVELPALIEGSSSGKANGPRILGVVRNADAIIMLIRNAKEYRILKNELENAGIKINKLKPKIKIERSNFQGITITGKNFLKMSEEEAIDILKSHGIYNASILLEEETTPQKLMEALDKKLVYKKCIIICKDKECLKELDENDKKNVILLNIDKVDDEELKKEIFKKLDIILVYTKKPHQKPDMDEPLILKKDATVEDVAEELHKGLVKKLKYARVWGSTKFPGQRVSKDYELKNKDIVEIVIA